MKFTIEKTEKAVRLVSDISNVLMTTNKRKRGKSNRGQLLLRSVEVTDRGSAFEIGLEFTRKFTKGFKVNGRLHEFYRASDHKKIVRKLYKLNLSA